MTNPIPNPWTQYFRQALIALLSAAVIGSWVKVWNATESVTRVLADMTATQAAVKALETQIEGVKSASTTNVARLSLLESLLARTTNDFSEMKGLDHAQDLRMDRIGDKLQELQIQDTRILGMLRQYDDGKELQRDR